MERGGRAWRGYFPVGGELTSGLPDQKEGLYLGAELPADHPLRKLPQVVQPSGPIATQPAVATAAATPAAAELESVTVTAAH